MFAGCLKFEQLGYIYIYTYFKTLVVETNIAPKMDGWNTSFLLGWPVFRGYVSFREGISPVLLDFDNWYGCYSKDIDNKLEVLFLFFSFLFLSSKVKFGFLAWFEASGSLVRFGFPPFLAVFFLFKRCFLAPFTALGVERLLETPPLFGEAMFYFVEISFQQKEISMVDTYIPPSKKRTDKRFT